MGNNKCSYKPSDNSNEIKDITALNSSLYGALKSIEPSYGFFNEYTPLTLTAGSVIPFTEYLKTDDISIDLNTSIITVSKSGVYQISYTVSAYINYTNTDPNTPYDSQVVVLGVSVNDAPPTKVTGQISSLQVLAYIQDYIQTTANLITPITKIFYIPLEANSTLKLITLTNLQTSSADVSATATFSISRLSPL